MILEFGGKAKKIVFPLKNDTLKKKLKKYPRPKNCEKLKPIKCNTEIWNNLNSAQRGADLSFQKTQTILGKSTSALLEIADLLTQKPHDDNKLIMPKIVDAIGLMGKANQSLNKKRREALKYALPNKMQKIIYNVPTEASELFGDKLDKRIKTITAANNALTKSTYGSSSSSSSSYRYKPYNKPSNVYSKNVNAPQYKPAYRKRGNHSRHGR